MRKSSIPLQKCQGNESSHDDGVPHTISRRGFLGSSALVVLPVLCGACGSSDPPTVDLPAVSGNTIVFPLSQFPELAKPGGSILGTAKGYANPIVIARVHDDVFAALDAVCTHQHCIVEYNALNVTLDCPCHGSTYEVDGTVIGGPAPRPLTRLTAQSDGTNLTITLA
jgi:Rieske Fe-S protein